MSDWTKVDPDTAARIRAGEPFLMAGDGTLVPGSAAQVIAQVEDALPAVLKRLFTRLAVEDLDDMDDLEMDTTTDLSAVLVTLHANGHTATERVPITLARH